MPEDTKKKHEFQTFFYKYIGKRFEKAGEHSNLQYKLKQGNINITPAMYYSNMFMISFLITAISFVAIFFIFYVIFDINIWIVLLSVCFVAIASLGAYPLTIKQNISNKRSELDNELPYTQSELSILASTGLSPIEIFRRMAERELNDAMSGEFKKIMYKIDMEGKDIISALGETASETSSDYFRETLWDLSNMINEGGSLDDYLRMKADQGLNLRRTIQKQYIEKLGTYSEIYSSVVLTMVIVLIFGAFMLDAIQSSYFGIDANTGLILITYLIVPMSILIMVSGIYRVYSYLR